MLSPKKYPFYVGLVLVVDVLSIVASFCVAYKFRFSGVLLPLHKGIPLFENYLRAMVIVVPIYLFIFRWYKLYYPQRHIRRIQELLNLVKAVTIAAVILMALTFIYREFSYSRMVLLFAWVFTIVFCSISRYFLIQFEYFIRSKKDRDRVLVIGMNRNARDLIRWARENLHYGQE